MPDQPAGMAGFRPPWDILCRATGAVSGPARCDLGTKYLDYWNRSYLVRRLVSFTLAVGFIVLGARVASGVSAAGPALRWSHPPRMSINTRAHYTATVKTSDGTFVITLLPKV